MKLCVHIKYYNPSLKIGLEDVRNSWLIMENNELIQLKTSIHQGLLYYRLPITGKRISYPALKKGLIKKKMVFYKTLHLLPF